MVYTCCVPACKTGYKSVKGNDQIPLFRFPKDEECRKKWMNAIPRQQWTLSDSHRVCAKHFSDDNIQYVSVDSRINAKLSDDNPKILKHKRLKPTAVPSIFSDLPNYLSKPSPAPRSTNASTASSRRLKENSKILRQNEEFLKEDHLDCFPSFVSKLSNTVLPNGYTSIINEKCAQFHLIQCLDDVKKSPKLLASVVVQEDFGFNAFTSSVLVPPKLYKHIMSSDTGILKKMSEFCNLLAFCKALTTSSINDGSDNSHGISLAVSALESYLCSKTETQDEDLPQPLLQFIIEQLQLIHVPKNGRRYSTSLLTTSFFWQLTSSSLYKKLRSFFILPSISQLRRLSSATAVESRELDVDYLKQRTSTLTAQERIVTLMLDEVYTAQRVEYSDGAFVGLTEECTAAKTVLTFMIQSAHGRYKDVVCLIPVNRLDTKLLQFWLMKVLKALHDIVFVVALSCDNHVCNRSVF